MDLWDKLVESVTVEFRFLETEFGFTRTITKQPNIIYASDKLQVQIYYDVEGRHELDLCIRRLADNPHSSLSMGIGMLVRLNKVVESYVTAFPSTAEELQAKVKHLAELLQIYGRAILSGDLRDFEKLEQIERELAIKYGMPKQTK